MNQDIQFLDLILISAYCIRYLPFLRFHTFVWLCQLIKLFILIPSHVS